VLLLVGSSALSAQDKALSGAYRIYQGNNEIGRESFHRDAQHFTQVASITPINLRLESTNSLPGGRFGGFTLALRNLAGDSLRGDYQIERAGDSVKIVSTLPGSNPAPLSHPVNFDFILPPQSVASLAELLIRAGGRDTTWRVMAAGATTVFNAAVAFKGDSATVTMPGIVIYATIRGGAIATLAMPSQNARAVLSLKPDTLPPLAGPVQRPRPVYTAPPGAIYTAEEVRVPVRPINADTFSLGCTLTVPKVAKRPVPAVVTITGSGSQGRDEDLWPTVPGYAPFRQVAERLAKAGIATLRCDDRGKDASGGSALTATTADFAGDTRAQVAWLRSRPEIDSLRVGLVGHSEGGIIGPLLVSYDPKLKAMVILAGPAKPGYKVLIDQARFPVLQDSTLTPEQRAIRLAAADSSIIADSLAPGAWYQWFYHYDPIPIATRVKTPTLILQGALDRQVTAGQADTLAAAIRSNGNTDVTVKVFPGLNHLFLVSKQGGAPSEYGSLKDVQVPANVLETMALWLAARLARKP
jgi:alpha-beta hydrolase superfamily lysophospholipase